MIPKRLKTARLRANLTKEELGVLVGLTEASAYSQVSDYENGIVCPSYEMVCLFAGVLKVPDSYFYTLDDSFAEAVLELYEQYEAAKANEKLL